jgi:hypothetical protein
METLLNTPERIEREPTADAHAAMAARLRADGGMLTLVQAARICPAPASRRGHCSAAAVWNWILRGKRGVRLEAIRGPGKGWLTTAAALDRFWGALTRMELQGRGGGADRVQAPVPGPSLMEKRSAAARARLMGRQ